MKMLNLDNWPRVVCKTYYSLLMTLFPLIKMWLVVTITLMYFFSFVLSSTTRDGIDWNSNQNRLFISLCFAILWPTETFLGHLSLSLSLSLFLSPSLPLSFSLSQLINWDFVFVANKRQTNNVWERERASEREVAKQLPAILFLFCR